MSKHVVFVGIDGAQYSKLAALGSAAGGVNNLDVVEGYTGGLAVDDTLQDTVSGPGWSTLLTGVWSDEHGVTSNSNSPIASEVQSLFERIDTGIEDAKIASIVNWSDINTGHFGDETGTTDGTSIIDYEAHALSDDAVTDRVIDLIGTEAPTFTFLQLDDVDEAGHAHGFGADYDRALIAASNQVSQIVAAVNERMAENPDEEWLVLVSTDHGRNPVDGSGHGEQTGSERQIFIASNVDIVANGPTPATSVAATILDFLDLPTDGVDGASLLADSVDTYSPKLLSLGTDDIYYLDDDLEDLPLDAPLSFVLSENVQKGEGFVTIHRSTDGTVVEAIDVNSDLVTIDGGVVTVNHSVLFEVGSQYYVNVDFGAFTDLETDSDTVKVRLFKENFESLANELQAYESSTEKHDSDLTDWTPNAPDGWTSDPSTTPAGGVSEFYGWTFHDKNSWAGTAGDGRDGFLKGDGVVAVADGDEYNDGSVNTGSTGYKTLLETPTFDVSNLVDDKATLTFDSSWRMESPQEVRIVVTFDNGDTAEIMHWNSTSGSDDFKPDAVSETVSLTLDVPEGATTASISFEMMQAGNNWWWAIDNITVDAERAATGQGNPFEGIDNTHTFSFTTYDPTPKLVSTAPADDIYNVPVGAPLTLVLSEDIHKGAGAIVIHSASGSVIETIDVGSDQVSIDGDTVTVRPSSSLAYSSDYYVTVDAGAFVSTFDGSDWAFAGIDDETGWNFSTAAESAGAVAIGTDLIANGGFEDVTGVTGNAWWGHYSDTGVIPGWIDVNHNRAEVISGPQNDATATEGTYYFDLDAYGTLSEIAQVISKVETGATYQLTFSVIDNDPGSDDDAVVVTWGGQVVYEGKPASATEWTEVTVEIEGGTGDGSNTLIFKNGETQVEDWYGVGLDDVHFVKTADAPDNQAPVFSSATAFTIAENQTAVGTVEAVDPDDDAITYSLSGKDAALFDLDAKTGALVFKSAPDYENPGDRGGDNVYNIKVKATDADGLDETQNIKVTVTDVSGDILTGTAKADSLTGTAEADTLDGRKGADSLTGGAGNDTYIADNAKDQVIENANEGIDLVKASVSHTLASNVENLTLTGSKAIDGTGNDLDNEIRGNSAANRLDGAAGADTLVGDNGRDALNGGSGDDRLDGGANNDRLYGGEGVDALRGGAGKDTFLFKSLDDFGTSKTSTDTIFDFDGKGGDRIDLSSIDANVAKNGDQSFSFIGTDAFHKTAGELRYEKSGSDTYIYGDVDGDGKMDFALHLDDALNLAKDHFLL